MIVDTNISIDALRGKKEAIRFLESSDSGFSISVVSIAELYAGLRTDRERSELQAFLTTIEVHDVDQTIAMLAGEYLKRYAKSHDLQIADALIAATATCLGEELATLNTKHFPMLTLLRPY
ncbi:MAG TPA: type II toxin-antitoxin system VapC family toxin [Candidatus Kapabacteria bacterium]|nr:type II toxin-antitoxin system VapC family toxin [Candidatus Kapabacteria bacterium]